MKQNELLGDDIFISADSFDNVETATGISLSNLIKKLKK